LMVYCASSVFLLDYQINIISAHLLGLLVLGGLSSLRTKNLAYCLEKIQAADGSRVCHQRRQQSDFTDDILWKALCEGRLGYEKETKSAKKFDPASWVD